MPVSMGLPGAEGRGDGVAVAVVRDSMADPDSRIHGKATPDVGLFFANAWR